MGVGLDSSYLKIPNMLWNVFTNVVDGAINKVFYVLIDFRSHKLHTAETKTFYSNGPKSTKRAECDL